MDSRDLPNIFEVGVKSYCKYSQIIMNSVTHPTSDIYLLKVHNKNTRIMCEIRSKLTIKIPERRHLESF